jgi:hypothetical protein
LVVLTGARQTGKTTLSRRVYGGLEYIDLDAPEKRDVPRGLSAAGWAETVGDAVIGEAQKTFRSGRAAPALFPQKAPGP